jgi:glutamate synthase domain-containing protein 2
VSAEYAEKNFIKAINKGLLKTFSKMGISTLQSYRGAQVFEAVGLNQFLIDAYFSGTASRIEGVGLDVLAREAQMKHAYAFQPLTESETDLVVGGQYQYREGGEYHLLNPLTISTPCARTVLPPSRSTPICSTTRIANCVLYADCSSSDTRITPFLSKRLSRRRRS